MHVRLTGDALEDLQQLKDYLEPRSPQGLSRIQTAIFTTMSQLEDFPLLGRIGEIEGTHELSVPRTHYRLVYKINEPYYVDIIRVLHAKLKYPRDE